MIRTQTTSVVNISSMDTRHSRRCDKARRSTLIAISAHDVVGVSWTLSLCSPLSSRTRIQVLIPAPISILCVDHCCDHCLHWMATVSFLSSWLLPKKNFLKKNQCFRLSYTSCFGSRSSGVGQWCVSCSTSMFFCAKQNNFYLIYFLKKQKYYFEVIIVAMWSK